MQLTKEFSSKFSDFNIRKLASFINQPVYLNKKNQPKHQPILKSWRFILCQIFHFGGKIQSVQQQIKEIAIMQISKQEYYMALKIAMKQQIDKIAKTLKDLKAARSNNSQNQPQLIQSKTLFNQFFSYISSMMPTQQIKKCQQAKQIIQRNDVSIQQSSIEEKQNVQPKFFVKSIGHIKMVGEEVQKIIQIHEKVFGWGCGCQRVNCTNKWKKGRLFQILYIYFCHMSTIFQETINPSIKTTLKNDLTITAPNDSQCTEKSLEQMIKKQKQKDQATKESKKKKKRKRKNNKKSQGIQDQKQQNEQQMQCEKTILHNVDSNLIKQLQRLPNKLVLGAKNSSKKVSISVQTNDGIKKQITFFVDQSKQKDEIWQITQLSTQEQSFLKQQECQSDEQSYKKLQQYIENLVINEDDQRPCNVQQQWIQKIQNQIKKGFNITINKKSKVK